MSFRLRQLVGALVCTGALAAVVILAVRIQTHDQGRIIGWEYVCRDDKSGFQRCIDVPVYEHGRWGDPWAVYLAWLLILVGAGGGLACLKAFTDQRRRRRESMYHC